MDELLAKVGGTLKSCGPGPDVLGLVLTWTFLWLKAEIAGKRSLRSSRQRAWWEILLGKGCIASMVYGRSLHVAGWPHGRGNNPIELRTQKGVPKAEIFCLQ